MPGPDAPIEAVIFDVGGVLIQIEINAALKAVSSAISPGGADLSKLSQHQSMLDFECGRISGPQFHAEIERLVGRPFPYDHFCHVWNSIFQDEIEATVSLLEDLRKRPGLKTGILSNTNSLHFDWLRKRMRALQDQEHIYASHEIGFRKPEPEAYRHVLEQMKVRPERSVFIDDYPENLEGAKAVGMRVIHATGPESVRSGLAALGVFCAEKPSAARRI